MREQPLQTPYGDLYLTFPIRPFNIGTIPSNGVLVSSQTVPSWWVTERRIGGLDEFFEALATSIRAHKYSVGWVDALARDRHLGRGILMTGDPAPEFMTVKARRSITVPFDLPAMAMSRLSMVLFNALYRNRVRGSRTHDVDFRRFVFPLDALLEWNRLYGQAGAVQFQCLIPAEGARPAFREILTLASEGAVASPLARNQMSNLVPFALTRYDLPDLARAMTPRPVVWTDPRCLSAPSLLPGERP